jgi:predicted PurR-regulated permease PerM
MMAATCLCISFLCSVVGPSLVWGPAAIMLALGGHWGRAIALVVWGCIVIGFLGNLLYPILLGRRLRLHTMAVFIAMVGGLFLFGACGFFLGPITLGATLALVGIWKERALSQALELDFSASQSEVDTKSPST